MGLDDRGYWSENRSGGSFRFGQGRRIGFPKPSSAVKTLLVINIVVFVLQLLLDQPSRKYGYGFLSTWFGVMPQYYWQIWRYITFQFLHSTAGFFHILFNMLGLYFLGTPLEQRWGSKKFVRFYLTCGVVGGIVYTIVGQLVGKPGVIIGASGGVYGIVLAAAVFFPHFKLLFFFFPVPIRLACAIIGAIMGFYILSAIGSGDYENPEFWSHVCHLGGAGAAAVWIWVLPSMSQKVTDTKASMNEGAWQRKMQQKQKDDQEIDRILAKIKDKGITSLSSKEKKILQQATKRQQEEERKISRL